MISWDRVNELRDEVGQDDFLEVVEIFLEEVDEVMERLKASPAPSTLEAELHFLKGSALNLGFAALSQLCQQGEKDAATQNFNAIDLPSVLVTYESSKAEFNNGGGTANAA